MKFSLLVTLLSIAALGHSAPQAADRCSSNDCTIDSGCRCSSSTNPISDAEHPAPQLVSITISESVVQTLYDNYLEPLFFNRTNADGSPVGLTFYVPHEYTDYGLVQDLYVRGYEIGDHSITKNSNQSYWRNATQQDLEEEFAGQKIILTTFANIPEEDIVGVRTPQLALEGDITFAAYTAANLTIDNSWPTLSTERMLPYTLDYASTQKCVVTIECPSDSHPAFWVAPITNIKGADNIECNSLATCLVTGTADDIADWLFNEVDAVRQANRAPLNIRLDTYWFLSIENSFDGFAKFLDRLNAESDVFLVSVQDAVEWIKNPVSADSYTVPDHSDRDEDCLNINCRLQNEQGEERYMKSCVPCPDVYPWKGNPYGEAQL